MAHNRFLIAQWDWGITQLPNQFLRHKLHINISSWLQNWNNFYTPINKGKGNSFNLSLVTTNLGFQRRFALYPQDRADSHGTYHNCCHTYSINCPSINHVPILPLSGERPSKVSILPKHAQECYLRWNSRQCQGSYPQPWNYSPITLTTEPPNTPINTFTLQKNSYSNYWLVRQFQPWQKDLQFINLLLVTQSRPPETTIRKKEPF